MTKNNSILEVFETEFAELSAKLNGSANSAGHLSRISALEAVSKTGLPNRKNEEYRYTPLSLALEKNFQGFTANESTTTDLGANELPALEGSSLVFINGVYSRDLSSVLALHSKNITVAESQKELLKEEQSEPVSDSYANLNLALATSGVKISVEKNVVLEAPINIIHITNTAAGRAIATVRHEIVVGENAQATVSEFFIGDGTNSSFTNSTVESVIHKNGILNHYKLGLDGENDLRVDNTTCHQHGNSVFNTNNLNFGGKIIRNNLTIVLDGEYCESNLDGLYIPITNGTIDNHSVVDHRLPNSNSNELYKGIMTDNSTGVFNGKVFVRPDAQKTNAFQSNKNILMADTATINTKPQLEIWADDVKCSHGCTTGQLDREQLFYLRARGIDEMNARKLLLKAFAEEVIDRLKDEGIKAIAEAALDKKLG